MKFLLNFDLFTYKSFFSYHSSKRLASYPGLFVSMIVYAFLFYIFLTSDMIQRKNPSTWDEIMVQTSQNMTVEFGNENFFPLILVIDQNGDFYNYFDPTIWSISIYATTQNSQSIQFMNSSMIVNCSFFTNNSNYAAGLCINNDGSLNLTYTDTTAPSFIRFIISLCVNYSDSDVVCKPYDQIYDFVKGKAFVFTFIESTFDLNNYENPVINNLNHAFVKTILNPEVFEEYALNIMQIEFNQIKNLIFQELETEFYYQQDYIGSNFDFYIKRNQDKMNNDLMGMILSLTLAASPNKRVITRKYQQLTDVLGKLGGLLSVAKILGSVFLSVFSEIIILKGFLNKLYDSPIQNNKKKERRNDQLECKIEMFNQSKNHELNPIVDDEISKLDIKNLEKSNATITMAHPLSKYLQYDETIENKVDECELNKSEKTKYDGDSSQRKIFHKNHSKSTNQSLLKIIENIKKKLNETQEKIRFSTFSYLKLKMKSFCNLILPLNLEEKMILIGEKLYEQETDVLKLVKRSQDIEKLKNVFFSKEQRTLFEFAKPTFSIDNEEIDQDKEKQEIKDVLNFYQDKIKKNEALNEIDIRLLEFYNNIQSRHE